MLSFTCLHTHFLTQSHTANVPKSHSQNQGAELELECFSASATTHCTQNWHRSSNPQHLELCIDYDLFLSEFFLCDELSPWVWLASVRVSPVHQIYFYIFDLQTGQSLSPFLHHQESLYRLMQVCKFRSLDSQYFCFCKKTTLNA